MTTKMKGLLKGLRYISQIFDEEKEQEMQIGIPTDVKHVAHIGWNGPSVQSPSWMNEYRTMPEYSSAPLSMGNAPSSDNLDVKWDSEDSSRRSTRSIDSPARDLPEVPRSSRRQSSSSGEKSERSKHSSKSSTRKESSRQLIIQDPNSIGNDSPSHNVPSIPKKSRRKKSKDMSAEGSTTRSSTRSKGHNASNSGSISLVYNESPFSDPGLGGPGSSYPNNGHCQNSSLQVFDEREEKLGAYGIA